MSNIITSKKELAESGAKLAEMFNFIQSPAPETQPKPVDEPEEVIESEAEDDVELDTEEVDDSAESEVEEDIEEEPKKSIELSKEAYEQLVPITVNGKTELVPVKEAISGYQRSKDYTRKTEELANQRRSVENTLGELHNIIEKSMSEKAVAARYLRSELPSEDELYKLANEDPDRYVAEKAKAERINARIAQIQQEAQAEMAEYERQQANNIGRLKQQGLEILQKEMPHLLTDEGQRKLINFAVGNGYTEQQIRSIIDPRMIITLEEQRLWREHQLKIMQNKKTVKSKVKQVKSSGRGEQIMGESAKLRQLKQNVVNNRHKKGRAGLKAAAALFAATNGLK